MAKDKKSFILYRDLIHTVKKLIVEDRQNNTNNSGELFYHLLQYVNDEDPEPTNMIVDLTFEPIKQHLKRDLVKYEGKKKQWSEAGKASAEVRRLKALNESNEGSTDSTSVENRSTVPTVSDSDSDNVIVNDNDNESKEREETAPKKIKKFKPPDKELVWSYMLSEGLKKELAGAEAEKFINHYTSVGWKVGGKAKMVDWQSAVRGWMSRMDDFKSIGNATNGIPNEPDMQWYKHFSRTPQECMEAKKKWLEIGWVANETPSGILIDFKRKK